MRRLFIAFLIIMAMVSCKQENDVVAEVGDFTVTRQELADALSRRFPKMKNFRDLDMKKKRPVLNQLIRERLKLNAAYDMGLDKDPEIVVKYTQRRTQMLKERAFERLVIDSLISDSLIMDAHQKSRYELRASHILIGYASSSVKNVTRNGKQAHDLAVEIKHKLQNGADFEKLALQYSDDPNVKSNHGNLGFFNWGRMVRAFQDTAYALEPGQIGGPVLTRYGFHIIRLDEKRPNKRWQEELTPLERRDIKYYMFGGIRDSGMARWEKLVERKKKRYHYQVDEDAVKKLQELNLELDKKNMLRQKYYTDEQKELVLAGWDGGRLTGEELLAGIPDEAPGRVRGLIQLPRLKKYVEKQSEARFVAFLAETMGVDKEADIVRQLDKYLHYLMVRAAERREIKDKVHLSRDTLRAYYDTHPSEFLIPEKLELSFIYCKDRAKIDKVYKLARQGRDFRKLAETYSDDAFYAKKGGYVGFRAVNGFGKLAREAFKHGPNQIIEPVPYKKGWAIVKTGPKKENVLRSFEDAYNQIRVKLKQLKTRERRGKWERELQDKYSVTINETLLASI
ncbi:MAG: hypothetical protein D6677_02665 [Calditrichaeota bacterium]|nr:MAG: hypothetical protein D6677_02665 [Calditrichota bacterium]